ncbi:MAG: PHB depolymerase family esterase [Sulfitobacter sp.]
MKPDFTSALRRATELVRAGNPAAATEMIQSSLAGNGAHAMKPTTELPSAHFKMPDMGQLGKRQGLAETLASLASKIPAHGLAINEPTEPTLPEGARFDRGTFSCASGSREYRVYIPSIKSDKPAALIMMLHGCTQSPVDFANGTDMNRIAEEQNLIVVYPAQSRGANMQSCWNWFGPADQDRNAGEPAILAGLAQQLQREHDIPDGKTFVAGLSAGAAMAVILGRTYPEVFAAVCAHSGLPYKAAHDVPSAFAAMGGNTSGPAPAPTHRVPTIVFHGTSDSTVNAANGQRIADDARPAGTEVLDDGTTNGRKYERTTSLSANGESIMEYWRIDGLGHAWSGGNAAGSYADITGPDASAEMVRFFLDLPLKGN